MRALSILMMILASWMSVACDAPERTTPTKLDRTRVHYPNSEEQRAFKEALAAAAIPHEVRMATDGKEWVSWARDQDVAVAAVQEQMFGPELPSGRNLYVAGEAGTEFKAWLRDNRIPYKTMMKRGNEYVVWAVEDSSRVRKWPYFPPMELSASSNR